MEVMLRSFSRRPRGRFVALAFLSASILLSLSAPAFAQGNLVDTAVDGVGDTVDDAVDGATDAVDDVTDTVDETVDDVAESTGTEAGAEGGPVDDLTDTINGTADATGDTVDRTVDGTTDTVDQVTQGRVDPITDAIDEATGGNGDGLEPGGVGSRGEGTTDRDPGRGTRPSVDGFVGSAGFDRVLGVSAETASEDNPRTALTRSPAEQVVQRIGDLLPRIAFPMVLLLLVAMFLVFQGRFDRSDPKLALAPLDIDHEYLSFR